MNNGWIISMRLTPDEYALWSALKEMSPQQTWAGAWRYLVDDPFIKARIDQMIDDFHDFLGG